MSDRKETRVELKYCKRCGGLWLRPVDSKINYCRLCAAEVEERAERERQRLGGQRTPERAKPARTAGAGERRRS